MQNSPTFFERAIVDLLVKMGYGGSFQDASARLTPRTGDGGVDGVINEDRLGLDRVYVQPAPLIDQLPEPDLFEQWIAAQVHLKGAAWLRQVVIALGGQALHGKDQLASELMRITRGDPQKLQPLVRVST